MSPTVALVSDATEFAGAEMYIATLVEALSAERDFVALVGDRAPAETQRRLRDAGARVELVHGLRRRPAPGSLPRLLRAIENVRPAVLHVNASDQGDALVPLLAAGVGRRPSVATLHVVVPGRAGWRESLSAFSLRRPDKVIAVSDAVGVYARAARAETVVVRNGIPRPQRVPDARTLLGVAPDAFVVGGIGRLHLQKGWDVLCGAARRIREQIPDAEIVVIGEGTERSRLTGSEECSDVRFLGYRESASSLVGAFDVLVVPSRYEGFGLVAVEAMLMGVPVVASDVDSLPEVLGNCGILVAPENEELLADAVVRLAKNRSLAADLARRAEERARLLFGVERMARETAAIYDAVSA